MLKIHLDSLHDLGKLALLGIAVLNGITKELLDDGGGVGIRERRLIAVMDCNLGSASKAFLTTIRSESSGGGVSLDKSASLKVLRALRGFIGFF